MTAIRAGIPFLRAAAVCLLACLAFHATPARAQVTCGIDECGGSAFPIITLAPGDGSFAATELEVTVYWSDSFGLNAGTRQITVSVGGVAVQPQPGFVYDTLSITSTGRVTSARSVGIVQLPANGAPLTVTASICNVSSACAQPVSGTWVHRPPPQVIAVPNGGTRPRNEPLLERFRVVNRGTVTATYTLSGVCDGPATVCAPGAAQVTLAPGDSAVVGVNYRLGSAGMMGSVGLAAVEPQTGGEGFASFMAIAGPSAGPPGGVGDRTDLSLLHRGMCVTASVGPGAAYECGDLRLVHALPTTRVLNTPRTPLLLFNSQHAKPYPIVAAHVARDPGMAARPDSLRARLTVEGTVVATQTYRGITADVVRVALGWDASARATGVYGYTLEVTAFYPGQPPQVDLARGGRIAVVNRIGSPVGRGWWVAGVEQLVPMNEEELLWVGGDGSTRVYRETTDGTGWAGPFFDRPDTLRADPGGGWYRPLSGGARVVFDGSGRHVRTVGTLADTTVFTWSGSQLTQIRIPTGASGTAVYPVTYDFSYPAGMLAEVVAPADNGSAGRRRVVRLQTVGTEVQRIWDAQYRDSVAVGSAFDNDRPHVRFTMAGGQVLSRFARDGVPTFFRYDAAGRLSGTAVPLAAGDSIRLVVRAAEAQGLAAAVPEADVHTLINGPRGDTTVTRFVLDRWGAPVKVVNVLGVSTVLRRGSTRLPALVTSMRTLRAPGASGTDPRENEISATYDDRGNLLSTTDWRLAAADGRYSTTTYAYDPRFDAVTRVTGPEGQTTTTRYDAYGRPLWVQPGSDPARRVHFGYNPLRGQPGALYASGRVATVTLPATATLPQAFESYEYDHLGNLAATTSARQFHAYVTSDAIGQAVATRMQIDTTGSPAYQVDSAYYDVNGRVQRQVSRGPAINGRAAQRLLVDTRYDREGRPTGVTRSAPDTVPNVFTRPSVTTTWKYDAAGRRVAEIAPDSTAATLADNPRDSTVYNHAGVPVWTRTRRGDVLTTRYDALNRPLVATYPATSYAAEFRGIPASVGAGECQEDGLEGYNIYHSYPQFPNQASCGYQVPGDSTVFTYDPMTGALLTAVNSDAKVSRTWLANGLLQSETQQIRASDGSGFPHVHTLTYTYDLAGRRRQLLHPATLAASSAWATSYTYDAQNGALESVTDPLGNTFSWGYDARGQLSTHSLPGGVVNGYLYDQDGRMVRHTLDVPPSGGRVAQTNYSWDARGKLLRAINGVGAHDQFTATYSGLGHLVTESYTSTVASQFAPVNVRTTASAYWPDALANVHRAQVTSSAASTTDGWMGGTVGTIGTQTSVHDFRPQTGRLVASGAGTANIAYVYDAAGNTLFQTTADPSKNNLRSDLAQYYGADGKLRVVDRRNAWSVDEYRAVWEEYRYDALGRRVWVRTRHYCATTVMENGDPECVLNFVRRTVWDGDLALYEIQMPLGESESNGPSLVDAPGLGAKTAQMSGRVLNTYGPGIDQPLSVIRLGYRGLQPFAALPVWDPQGRAPFVVFPSGSRTFCPGPCFDAAWWFGEQAYGMNYNGMLIHRGNHDGVWLGNVMQDQHDASGLLYRRNRYYNPQTGRFTQEDPIGLAGGLNAYGYANGDPVSYADPYGLEICVKSPGLRQRIGDTFKLDIQWDSRGCIDRGGIMTARAGSDAYSELQERFRDVVDSGVDINVTWGTGGSFAQEPRGGRPGLIRIDWVQAHSWYGARLGGHCRAIRPWGQHALIAHEFGHFFNFAVRLGSIQSQGPAVDMENMYNAAAGRGERDLMCEPKSRRR